MAIALYDLTVASYLQTLEGVAGFLNKGLAHCQATGADAEALVEARLVEDMLPLRFQVQSVAHHSLGAIEGAKAGAFSPPGAASATSYADLQAMVAEAASALKALSPAEVNSLEGRDVVFKLGEHAVPFTAENFLMSFSLPNFYFHAATAYDILRASGVGLGKRDFLGTMRIKR
jgi:hypothetical protein